MTDRIILRINSGDPYTDYLFQTAAIADRHVVTMVRPSREDLAGQIGLHTKVIDCGSSRSDEFQDDEPVVYDWERLRICVYSRYYLSDSGAVDSRRADYVRTLVEGIVEDLLLDPENLREIYRTCFPILWNNREEIYSTPQLFYVKSGWMSFFGYDEYYPIGTVLKAIDEGDRVFRLSLRGGCACHRAPLLIDYSSGYGANMTLYTWCPVCGGRREVKTRHFLREGYCNRGLANAGRHYDRGQGFSNLTLIDLIDLLSSS